MLHRIDAALDIVQQRVARPLVHRADGVAGLGEGDLHRIVEAAAAEPFDAGAVRPAPPDARRQTFERFAVARLELVAVPAIGPVEHAVGTEEWTVNVAAVAVETEAGQ